MLQAFGYISAFLSIIMVIPYTRDILKRKTKPERASWFIWTTLGLIAFFSQFAKGATDSLWLTGGQTLAVGTVFMLSIKYGVGGLTKRDIKALVAAGFGLVIWYFTNEPVFALLMVIIVDSIGSSLTVIKSFQEPETETALTFAISAISGVFGAIAVGSFNLVLLAYPLYLVTINFLIFGAIILGRKYRNN